MKLIIVVTFTLCNFISNAQRKNRYNAIYSGVPWLDDKGNTVSAHGANILKDKGKYYLFGERHTDTSNAFAGFTCYSSMDLYNWKFESIALPVQHSGKLGPNRVGERPKVIYYFLGSNLTSWERNDNYYFTASSLKGPWTRRGVFCPEGTLTWNSQTTFVLPIEGSKDTTYMYMGDRWSFPKQASAATYVWQPLTISGTSISIPKYIDAWQINTSTGQSNSTTAGKTIIESANKQVIAYAGKWRQDTLSAISSDEKASSFSVKFTGTQAGFYGLVRSNGGYAHVLLQNGKGKPILTSIVDMYCKYPTRTLVFLSPILKKDNYTLTVAVMAEHGNWSDKRKNIYGSIGNFISLDKVVINQ